MNNNLVNIEYFDNEKVQYNIPVNSENDAKMHEMNVYIDSNVLASENNKYKFSFIKKLGISSIYVREVIIKYNEEFINAVNDNKFLILRFKDFNETNNNIVYNTSNLNPDTDLILNKSHIIEPYYNFDSKYMMNNQTKNKVFTSLQFEILDHHAHPFPFKIEFFMDMKINSITF